MIKKISIIILSILIFIACDEQNDTVNETVIPVKVFNVKPNTISQYLRLTGSVEAENDAVVFAKLNEKIEKIYVRVGQNVKKDEVIAEQYNEILKQNLEMAKAGLKSAESQFILAKQNHERMLKLFEQKAVSPQQFDQAESQMKTLEANLDLAKSQLKQAEENYENSFIKAPFAGVIAAINFDENQMVTAGQPVAQVVNSKSMKAKLMVSGTDANHVEIGQLIEIEFPSIPEAVYQGKVNRINKALSPVTNALEIEVLILNADERVKSGLFGKFNLELVTKDNVIIIPETAVQQQTEVKIDRETGVQKSVKKHFTYKIDNDRAVLTEIKIGINSDGRVEITDGLSEGDRVVVVGQNIIKDGDLVKIIE
ncbi:MAG: efflux RND transporter periplasmic adaptor subunit [Melioribacteraceae bacterium]|nr:efflux RND transporter periplasmic adaptor subunit [Melioribacteraceae bacterium]